MRRVLPLLALASCTIPPDVSRVDRAPTGSVLSPSPDSELPSGRVELLGRVADDRDPAERLYVAWSLGDEGSDASATWQDACVGFAEGDGTTRCVTELAPWHTRVRLLVKDVAGYERRVVVTVRVRDAAAPVVTLEEPDGLRLLYANLPVRLRAAIRDADHPPEALVVRWESSVVGRLDGPEAPDDEGRVQGLVRLGEGTHRVTLTATDPDGLRGSASIVVEVAPDKPAPTARVTAPADGAAVHPSTPLTLRGVVLDGPRSPSALQARWESDVAGLLGTATPDAAGRVALELSGLALGDHVLRLSAEDEGGQVGEDEITLIVDTPPTVVWTAPADGRTYGLNDALEVAAGVADARSAPEELHVRLTSDVVGLLAEGPPAASGAVAWGVGLPPPGVHVLTLTATDPLGLTTTLTRTVTVTHEE